MKKLLALTLAILLTLTVVACGNTASQNNPSDNNTPPPGQTENSTPTPEEIDATGRTIVISNTEGNDVKMTRGEGREYDATSGTRMSDGYTAHTGSASHISLLFDNDSTIKTDEQTNVEVEQISAKKLSLVILSGAIVADITSLQSDESIDFKAGNVTLGIRGTSFIMEYRNENEVGIIMLEGSGIINGDTLLEAGQIATISLHDISIEPLTTASPLSAFALFEIGVRIILPESSGDFQGFDERGTFEGDINGWGVWNFRWRPDESLFTYEGYFVNGVPNGEGSLVIVNSGGHTQIYQGTLVEGVFHGTVTRTAEPYTYIFEANMGYSTVSETRDSQTGETTWQHNDTYYRVPPWGSIT